MYAVDQLDMTPRYAPRVDLVCGPAGFAYLPVLQTIAHPPGNHPANCPLIDECTALELRTFRGSRWFGCLDARINSELRMVVVGTNPRDEVRMAWPIAEA